MPWNQTDLSKFMIAGAQYGGPIGNPLFATKKQPTDACYY
jgi:hypothetical protein